MELLNAVNGLAAAMVVVNAGSLIQRAIHSKSVENFKHRNDRHITDLNM